MITCKLFVVKLFSPTNIQKILFETTVDATFLEKYHTFAHFLIAKTPPCKNGELK